MAVVCIVEPQPHLNRDRSAGNRLAFRGLAGIPGLDCALHVALDDARAVGIAAVQHHLHLRAARIHLAGEIGGNPHDRIDRLLQHHLLGGRHGARDLGVEVRGKLESGDQLHGCGRGIFDDHCDGNVFHVE